MSENVMASSAAAMDAHMRSEATKALRHHLYESGSRRGPVEVDANALLALLDRVSFAEARALEAGARVLELEEVRQDCREAVYSLSDILRQTAAALRGPADEQSSLTWHHLPGIARELRERNA